MAAWTFSRSFAHLSRKLCRRTLFSGFKETTATTTRQSVASPRNVIFDQIRAASNASKSLCDYFSKELKYQRDMLDHKAVSDLPSYKDFELKIDEYGDVTFTRNHKGDTVTVWLDVNVNNVNVQWHSEEDTSSDDSSDDEQQLSEATLEEVDELAEGNELDEDDEYFDEEADLQDFHVSVTPNKKAADEVTFTCEFTVDAVYDDMYEEDIYDITSVGIGNDGFCSTEMNTRKMPNDLYEIYYEFLKERGVTQEFLHFLRNTFLPAYLHYYYVEKFLKPVENFTKCVK